MNHRDSLAVELVALRRITELLGETIPVTDEPEQVRRITQELRRIADNMYYTALDWRNDDLPTA